MRDDAGVLVGGLYGVAVGGLFAGESMFHHATDASKAALVHLDRLVAADGDERRIIDVQWRTAHLATLGIEEIHRREYLARLWVERLDELARQLRGSGLQSLGRTGSADELSRVLAAIVTGYVARDD